MKDHKRKSDHLQARYDRAQAVFKEISSICEKYSVFVGHKHGRIVLCDNESNDPIAGTPYGVFPNTETVFSPFDGDLSDNCNEGMPQEEKSIYIRIDNENVKIDLP